MAQRGRPRKNPLQLQSQPQPLPPLPRILPVKESDSGLMNGSMNLSDPDFDRAAAGATRIDDQPAGEGSQTAGSPEVPGENLEAAAETAKVYLDLVIDFPFEFAAKRFGDHWKLDADEREKLLKVSSAVLRKHLPAIMAKQETSDEWALGMVLLAMVITRTEIFRNLLGRLGGLETTSLPESQGQEKVLSPSN